MMDSYWEIFLSATFLHIHVECHFPRKFTLSTILEIFIAISTMDEREVEIQKQKHQCVN